MSNHILPKPRVGLSQRSNICIVASQFNEEFTDALVQNALEEIGENLPNANVDLFRVPGAFEIPVTVSAILSKEKPGCIIALGVIIRGKTSHADLVATSVTNSLQELATKALVPVINEVLLLDDEKQAYARCVGNRLNRGREAARSAQAMLEIMDEILRPHNKSARLHPSNV